MTNSNTAKKSHFAVILLASMFSCSWVNAQTVQIVRYQLGDTIAYGQINNDKIQTISGDPFGDYQLGDQEHDLTEVKLLLPFDTQKVFAVGMNFASHIASPSSAPPPLFLKLPTSLISSGEDIHLPPDAGNVHFEGELVLVIGKQAKSISEAQSSEVIYGVTVGNDLTERSWQSQDLQWMRSKASDGFGPISPIVSVGVDYNNVQLTTKLNGEVVQQENTRHMIHSPAKVVSYLSQYFTLMPGDLIFMGTPGRTQALADGDVVSVEIEHVGKVENTIKQQN